MTTDMHVSSVVNSILEAFTNGMDVFVRLKGRRRKKSKPSRMGSEELKLYDSLLNRPKEIQSEYSQSVVRHGKHFERGDDAAYSSLSHTLLILNTGLINLINNALSSDMTDKSKSRQNLLLLSENAAANTIFALSQLNKRLTLPNQTPIRSAQAKDERRSEKASSYSASSRSPPSSPLLVRGGWVRSKSGSSVVSAATARKLAAQNNHQKSRSKSPESQLSSLEDVDETSGRLLEYSSADQSYSYRNSPVLYDKDRAIGKYHQDSTMVGLRAPSMLLVSADYFTSHDTDLYANTCPPPRPPKVPLHSRPNPRTGPRPISTATFMTASTKIGEIPEHVWPTHIISEEERDQLPLPYVIPPPLEPPRSKSKGLKFWKKSERKLV